MARPDEPRPANAPWSDADCLAWLRTTHAKEAEAAFAAFSLPAPVRDLRAQHDLCQAVLAHLAHFARTQPQAEPPDAFCALAFVLGTRLGHRRAAARAFALHSFGAPPVRSAREAAESILRDEDRVLLAPVCVRSLLAAEELVRLAAEGLRSPLPERSWPESLVEAAAHLLQVDPVLMHRLTDVATKPPRQPSLLLSLLCDAIPGFRPPVQRYRDLAGARLCGIDLSGADLAQAQLHGVDLANAKLGRADLRKANLVGAKLAGADLRGARLVGANLAGADLTGADLRGAERDALAQG
jgi:hypothetical protein